MSKFSDVLQSINNVTHQDALKEMGAMCGINTNTENPVVNSVYGAGAVSTAGAPKTYRWQEGNDIVTEIHFDLTGLGVVGTAAKDAIGLAAGGDAYIGRYVVAKYGVVYKVELICLEAPGEGTATITQDIDLGAEDDSDVAYDGPVDDVIVNTDTLVAGEVATNAAPALTADDYIYIIEGDTAATTGVYSAGQFVARFTGKALSF